MTFVQIYIGYDLIDYFAEKLFAGSISFRGDIKAFIELEIVDPNFIVTLARPCELRDAIAIGLGFFTRLGSFGITLYLLIATVLGKHFHHM
ncbi:DoxX family protein [Coxiella-like endosymbiont]|uniref:DoxX family protein n=1 Tax=Coxiella-like endosymbiont TaxID=1592897 RepID=UPI0027297140|nr:DoxX family protein [Coxiella-like endosymbiont]